MAGKRWKPNKYENAFIETMRNAMAYIPGDSDLEMQHVNWKFSKGALDETEAGWYAFEYNEKRGSAEIIEELWDKPLISDKTIREHCVDVKKCFKVVGCCYVN